MTRSTIKFSAKFMVLIVSLIIINTNSFSLIIANRGDENYEKPVIMSSVDCGETTSLIEQSIVRGAGQYLQGYADFLLFLNKIELSDLQGMDYYGLCKTIAGAIDHMEQAGESYTLLVAQAQSTPYRPQMIEGLMAFDYRGYGEKKGLNPFIFAETAQYLEGGDVTGLFAKLQQKTNKIIAKLYMIKFYIDWGVFPDLSLLWQLNQEFSHAMLLGQYGAQVFYENVK